MEEIYFNYSNKLVWMISQINLDQDYFIDRLQEVIIYLYLFGIISFVNLDVDNK